MKFPAGLSFTYHLGVGYIHAYLRARGVDSTFYTRETPSRPAQIVKEVLEYHSRMIGFTCCDNNYYCVKLISRELKKAGFKNPIVVGGPTATFTDRLIMEDHPDVDICVRGEGEYTVFELLQAFNNNTPLYRVKGITFREKGKIIRTEDRPLITSIDEMPSPYLTHTVPPRMAGELGILTARGCSHTCTYCLFSAMSRRTVRFYSIERIMAELYMISQYAREKTLIKIYDDSFSINPGRVMELCRRIREEGLPKYFNFWCETRADSVDRELLEILYQSGFKQISFGLESAAPEILRIIKKVPTDNRDNHNLDPEKKFLEKVRENVAAAKGIGFSVDLSIILGLPGETPNQGKQTMDFIKQTGPDVYYHNILSVHPGTELFDSHDSYHIQLKNMLAYGGIFQTLHAYDTSGIEALDNAFVETDIKNIAGITEGTFETGTGVSPAAVFFNHDDGGAPGQAMCDEIFTWLAGIVNFQTRVFLASAVFNKDIYLDYRKKIAAHHVPVLTLLFLGRKQGSDNYPFGFNTYPVFYDLLSTPFSVQNREAARKHVQIVLLTLDTPGDLDRFVSLAIEAAGTGKIKLGHHILNSVYSVEDGCRWHCRECPAPSLFRIIIEPNGTVRPCLHGQVIGNVGDDFDQIKKKLHDRWVSEIKKRGCGRCPAREFCSKCLFPHPVDTGQYCRIRKAHRYLPGIIDFFDITRRVPLQKPGKKHDKDIHLLVFPGAESNPLRLKTSLRAFSIGEDHYIHDAGTHKTRPVGHTVMEIISRLKQGKTLEEIGLELVSRYGVTGEYMNNKLDTFMAMCKQSGYLIERESQ